MNYLIDQLVITIGQWSRFKTDEYKQQFESLMEQLQRATGLDWDGAVAYLENAVEGEKVA